MTNQRVSHPTQPNMFAEVVLASKHPITGVIVYTMHLRYPRIVHGELMTHRVFNRNARSSRAVPIKTLLREIKDAPFIPWHWTKNQKGMQGVSGWSQPVFLEDGFTSRENAWLSARDEAVRIAEAFNEAEYHKQIANRLLEPFMWMDLLVTSTDWKNFLHLRDHPDAEPHIRDLAILVKKAIESATVQELKEGEWHTPYIKASDWLAATHKHSHCLGQLEIIKRVSAARCARISYAPFDGVGTFEREIERFEALVGNDAVHASPLEHQCTPDSMYEYRKVYSEGDSELVREWSNGDKHGSLRGFIQFRKTIKNEAIHE